MFKNIAEINAKIKNVDALAETAKSDKYKNNRDLWTVNSTHVPQTLSVPSKFQYVNVVTSNPVPAHDDKVFYVNSDGVNTIRYEVWENSEQNEDPRRVVFSYFYSNEYHGEIVATMKDNYLRVQFDGINATETRGKQPFQLAHDRDIQITIPKGYDFSGIEAVEESKELIITFTLQENNPEKIKVVYK